VTESLFIDTNVFLSFYHYSGENLEELKKLAVLLKKHHVQMFLPQQVVDEFHRNRDKKIDDAMSSLKSQKYAPHFPQMCKDYDEYVVLRGLQKECEAAHAALMEKTLGDATGRTLKADAIISDLFAQATRIPATAEIVAAARNRMELGNPPGKNGSLGDAINWESLLSAVPAKTKINFITDDQDYASALDRDSFASFLADEWAAQKSAEVAFYRRISAFTAAKYPQIKFANDMEKQLLIDELASSGSFHTTHQVVAKLRNLGDFTPEQTAAVLTAVTDNEQVGWIAGDADVRGLLQILIADKEDELDAFLVIQVRALMGPDPEPADMLPF